LNCQRSGQLDPATANWQRLLTLLRAAPPPPPLLNARTSRRRPPRPAPPLPPSPPTAVVLATVLPLLGLGRRVSFSVRLQLVITSQLGCYALRVCPGARGPGAYELLPAAYYAVG
jgi:hypothetical protein